MPFLLTTLAGISTLIGTLVIFIKRKNNNIIISSLAFAGSVMIMVSITDLIPEAYHLIIKEHTLFESIILILLFMNVGIIISMLIDKYLPNSNELYRVGIVSMIAIILHNIPEGIATFVTSSSNIGLGITLTLAIAAHNIPEGITIALPIFYSTGSKFKAIIYTLTSGLSELFGATIAFLFLKPVINDTNLGVLFAIIEGIMIHISIYELFPTSFKYKKYGLSIISIIIGILFILITHNLFSNI